MPKIIDHDERRQELIAATWRIIAEEGIGAATTRRIAEATGRANGTLLYYFPNKAAVVAAALRYTFDATNARIRSAAPAARGRAGLRAMCLEILPISEVARLEARIVLESWHHALADADSAAAYAAMMAAWRADLGARLREGVADGEFGSGLDVEAAVGALLGMLMGQQALSVFTPEAADPAGQIASLDAVLGGLG